MNKPIDKVVVAMMFGWPVPEGMIYYRDIGSMTYVYTVEEGYDDFLFQFACEVPKNMKVYDFIMANYYSGNLLFYSDLSDEEGD